MKTRFQKWFVCCLVFHLSADLNAFETEKVMIFYLVA